MNAMAMYSSAIMPMMEATSTAMMMEETTRRIFLRFISRVSQPLFLPERKRTRLTMKKMMINLQP